VEGRAGGVTAGEPVREPDQLPVVGEGADRGTAVAREGGEQVGVEGVLVLRVREDAGVQRGGLTELGVPGEFAAAVGDTGGHRRMRHDTFPKIEESCC